MLSRKLSEATEFRNRSRLMWQAPAMPDEPETSFWLFPVMIDAIENEEYFVFSLGGGEQPEVARRAVNHHF